MSQNAHILYLPRISVLFSWIFLAAPISVRKCFGHDHRGEMAFRNGIHYFVLEGNVGMSLGWSTISPTDGMDPVNDCPFTQVVILQIKDSEFNGMKTYQVIVNGNAHQYTVVDQVPGATL